MMKIERISRKTLVVGASIALLSWCCFLAYNRSGRKDQDPVRFDPPISVPIADNLEPRLPTSNQPQPEAKRPLPDDPRDGIDVLIANYSGDDLVQELNQAGIHYAKLGIETAKVFMLNLPPGEVGQHALTTAIYALSSEEDNLEMIAFLKTSQPRFPANWVARWLAAVRLNLAKKDPAGAVHHLASSTFLTPEEKRREVLAILYISGTEAMQDQLISVVDTLDDQELSRAMATSEPYLLAKLQMDPRTMYSGIAEMSEGDRKTSLSSLGRAIPRLPDPQEALDELAHSSVPGKEGVLGQTTAHWIKKDMNAALSWVATIEDAKLVDNIISVSWKTIADFDTEAARTWISSIQNDKTREMAEKNFEEAFP